MKKIVVALAVVTMGWMAQPAAGQVGADYRCIVKEVTTARDDGTVGATEWTKMVAKEVLGTEVYVERSTGRLIAPFLSNQNAFGLPEIIDPGSDEQAFKVITVYSPYAEVFYLRIEEYAEGPEKPFLFLQGREIYTGICTHASG